MRIEYNQEKPNYKVGQVLRCNEGFEYIIIKTRDGLQLLNILDETGYTIWLCPPNAKVYKEFEKGYLHVVGEVIQGEIIEFEDDIIDDDEEAPCMSEEEMLSLEAGDKLELRDDLVVGKKYEDLTFYNSMFEDEITFRELTHDGYINVFESSYGYSREMFKPLSKAGEMTLKEALEYLKYNDVICELIDCKDIESCEGCPCNKDNYTHTQLLEDAIEIAKFFKKVRGE